MLATLFSTIDKALLNLVGETIRDGIYFTLMGSVVVWFIYDKLQTLKALRAANRQAREADEAGPEPEPQPVAAPTPFVPKTRLAELDPAIYALTPDRQMIVALGALYSQMGGTCQKLETSIRERGLSGEAISVAVLEAFGEIDYDARLAPGGVLPHCRKVLSDWWDIASAGDVASKVRKLLAGDVHQSSWASMVEQLKMRSPEEAHSPLDIYVRQLAGHMGPAGILAWDYARAVHVTRLATAGGLVTPAQAWQMLAPLPGIARRDFHDWHSYALSFVVGFKFWKVSNGNSLEATSEEERQELLARQADANTLLEHPYSPWRLANWSAQNIGHAANNRHQPIALFH